MAFLEKALIGILIFLVAGISISIVTALINPEPRERVDSKVINDIRIFDVEYKDRQYRIFRYRHGKEIEVFDITEE